MTLDLQHQLNTQLRTVGQKAAVWRGIVQLWPVSLKRIVVSSQRCLRHEVDFVCRGSALATKACSLPQAVVS